LDYDYPQPMMGRFVKNQLARIIRDAQQLSAQLGPDDKLPSWVQFKVSTAADRLHTASDYMRYKANDLGGARYPEGLMLKQTLATIERDAREINDIIGPNDRVAPWVPKFIYTAQDRLSVIGDYLRTAGANYGADAEADDSCAKVERAKLVSKYAMVGAGVLAIGNLVYADKVAQSNYNVYATGAVLGALTAVLYTKFHRLPALEQACARQQGAK